MGTPEECTHEDAYWEPGNYVPPFGWEQYPSWVCEDCGEAVEDQGQYDPEDDGDAIRDRRLEES